jgi:hypothetical protein
MNDFKIDLSDLEAQIRKSMESALDIDMKSIYPYAGEIISSDIQDKFDLLGQRGIVELHDGTTLTFRNISGETQERRIKGVQRDGKNEELPSWPPPRGYILQRTGDLMNSINYEMKGDSVAISYGMEYGDYLYDPNARGKTSNEGWNFLFVSRDALDDIVDIVEQFIRTKLK